MDRPHDRTHFSQISAPCDNVHETAQYLLDECMSTLPPVRTSFYVGPTGQTFFLSPYYANMRHLPPSTFPDEMHHPHQGACDNRVPNQSQAEPTGCIQSLVPVMEINTVDDLTRCMEFQWTLSGEEEEQRVDGNEGNTRGGSDECMTDHASSSGHGTPRGLSQSGHSGRSVKTDLGMSIDGTSSGLNVLSDCTMRDGSTRYAGDARSHVQCLM
jgi:hypothetical protein